MERLDARLNTCDQLPACLTEDADTKIDLSSLGVLVGVIAHEFNGLLAPLHLQAQRVLTQPDDPDTAHALAKHTILAAERASGLVASILDLAESTGIPATEHDERSATCSTWNGGEHAPGGAPAQPAPARQTVHPTDRPVSASRSSSNGTDEYFQHTSISSLIDGVLESFGSADGVTVRSAVLPGTVNHPEQLGLSPTALTQVLHNLVMNALDAFDSDAKASTSGSPEAKHARHCGHELWIACGPGSAPEPSPSQDEDGVIHRERRDTSESKRWTIETYLSNCRIDAQTPVSDAPSACSTRNTHKDTCWIMVGDTGPGISIMPMSRVFEPFVTGKAPAVASTAPSGTPAADLDPRSSGACARAETNLGLGLGLGLSIVRAIVERAGGSIRVNSHAGRGTVFTLVLPVATRTGQ